MKHSAENQKFTGGTGGPAFDLESVGRVAQALGLNFRVAHASGFEAWGF